VGGAAGGEVTAGGGGGFMDLGFRWVGLGFWGSYGWIPMIARREDEGVGVVWPRRRPGRVGWRLGR
jgi:hypothetical protein